jgi:hypothetical protein
MVDGFGRVDGTSQPGSYNKILRASKPYFGRLTEEGPRGHRDPMLPAAANREIETAHERSAA